MEERAPRTRCIQENERSVRNDTPPTLAVSQNVIERVAHSDAGSQYLLRCDEEERQRLSEQHQLYTRLLSGRLIFPPIVISGKDEVLDVGTGAGTWLCDARTHLPEPVQLYGVDIESSLFPSYKALSANVHFSICSGTALPSYWSSKFTLVHQRLLICAYTRSQWQRNIDEIYRVLVPGGYVQLIEPGPEWVSGPKTATQVLFFDAFFGRKDLLLRCGVYIQDILKTTGFVDVKSEEVIVKLGKWAGEDGEKARDTTIGAWRGVRDSVMQMGGLGVFASAKEYDKVLDEISDEWDNTEGSHTALRIFCGRKPF